LIAIESNPTWEVPTCVILWSEYLAWIAPGGVTPC